MATRGRSWSSRARRDFDERAEYRKKNDEKDRYEKKGDTEKETKDARRDERGYEDYDDDMSVEDFEATLMEIRNADPDTNVNKQLDRLRARYNYYETELDRYDKDYDDLMSELDGLRRDNQRYMMRDTRNNLDEAEERQDRDIKQDNDAEKDFDSLWKEREG